MWLHTSLEEVERLWAVGVRSNLLTTCVMQLWHLADERYYVAKELHKSPDTHVLARTNAEYREDGAGYESLAYSLTELVLRKRLLLEELLHQSFVVLGSSLNKSPVQFHGLVHLLGRNILDDRSTTLGFP